MSVLSGAERYGEIVYNNILYELSNTPLNQETIDKSLDVIKKCACIYFPTKVNSLHNLFQYAVKEGKLYITSFECTTLANSNITPCKNMFFELFNQNQDYFLSWFTGELKLVVNMTASGDSSWVFDYDLLVLKVKNGHILENYNKKEVVKGLKRLKNYIEE